MRNSDEPIPKKESSDDDLIDLASLSGYEILELAEGKYGKRDGGDGWLWFSLISLITVIPILIAGIFLVMFTVGPMLVDPLFLYVPTINENIKCLALDEKLKKTAIVLRSITDVPFLLQILGLPMGFFFIPLSLVEGLAFPLTCPFVLPDFLFMLQGGVLPKSRIHNILAVLPIPQVLGAFWYFFSIQREIDCWISTCRTENRCNLSTLQCDKSTFRNVTLLNDLCPTNPPNQTVYDFGIFIGTLQSGIVGTTNFPQKLLMCFSWGLRNLSSFASNLNSSTYAWESIFVIFISISGLLLFMYLLGHVQTFMQAISRRSDIWKQMRGIVRRIHFMVSEYGLKEEVSLAISKLVREALEEDDDLVVEENIFSVLPRKLQKHIKRYLFLARLKELPGLENKDRKVLDAIMKDLDPVSYADGSYIIREGEPLDRMIFITQGTALAYKTSTTGGESGSSSTTNLEKGNTIGEELMGWAATSTPFSGLPISDQTVKSHEKVEVFAIRAASLKRIVSDFSTHFNTELPHQPDSTTGETHVEIPS